MINKAVIGMAIVNSEDREDLLRKLRRAQAADGYVSEMAMSEIADSLGISIGEVFSVASFYSFLSLEPLGRHVIHVCKSVPCYLNRSDMVVKWISKAIDLVPGETSADGRFSLRWTNCIGACDQAPAMLLDGEVYGNLTKSRIEQILSEFN
jgi:NADH:ubiquinone oxidoreductase subunit E